MLTDTAEKKKRNHAPNKTERKIMDRALFMVRRVISGIIDKGLATGIETDLNNATTLEELLAVGFHGQRIIRTQHQHSLLSRIDGNPQAGEWYCIACSQRWGRHDSSTLACPNMYGLEKTDASE